MPPNLRPRAAAASPFSNRTNTVLPRQDTSARVASKNTSKRALSRKLLWRAPNGRTKPDLDRRSVAVVVASTPPQYSPQNTGDPLVGPTPSLSATEAVEVQLRALEDDDSPWQGHGVQTAYLFCRDSGSMEMSRYFCGKSASLYHEDHFVGKFRTTFPELLRPGARVTGVLEGGDGSGAEPVRVEVETAAAAAATGSSSENGGEASHSSSTLVFTLERCEMGRRKGSWLVAAVHRRGEEE